MPVSGNVRGNGIRTDRTRVAALLVRRERIRRRHPSVWRLRRQSVLARSGSYSVPSASHSQLGSAPADPARPGGHLTRPAAPPLPVRVRFPSASAERTRYAPVHANDRAASTATGLRCDALIQRLEEADAVHTWSRHLHKLKVLLSSPHIPPRLGGQKRVTGRQGDRRSRRGSPRCWAQWERSAQT